MRAFATGDADARLAEIRLDLAELWLAQARLAEAQLAQAQKAEAQQKEQAAKHTPDIESVHRDIGFAQQYRLELIKHLMTLAAGVLAFTVTFRPTLKPVVDSWLMWAGWIGLGLSLVGGLFHMLRWEYVSYRNYDFHGQHDKGEKRRDQITFRGRAAMIVQFVGFGVGVICIALFAAINLEHVVTKRPTCHWFLTAL